MGGRGGFAGGHGSGYWNGVVEPGSAGGGGAGLGGAVFNHHGIFTVTNSTLAANSAAGGGGFEPGSGLGGAIFNLNGQVTLTNSTLAANAAPQGGGALYNLVYDKSTARTAGVTLVNSILADSAGEVYDLVTDKPATVADGGANLGTAPVNATATNLIELRQVRAVQADATITGSPIVQDPRLGPLQYNGGPGMATMKPELSSPAVDAGQAAGCPSSDERGFPRPQGPACDLGAMEVPVGGADLSVSLTDAQTPWPWATRTPTP